MRLTPELAGAGPASILLIAIQLRQAMRTSIFGWLAVALNFPRGDGCMGRGRGMLLRGRTEEGGLAACARNRAGRWRRTQVYSKGESQHAEQASHQDDPPTGDDCGAARYREGWREYYWEPLQAYFRS